MRLRRSARDDTVLERRQADTAPRWLVRAFALADCVLSMGEKAPASEMKQALLYVKK
jgi:hypothetical protein